MELLQEILGDKYQEFETALNAYNARQKDKPIKLRDIGSGGYVGKGKYETIVRKKEQLETQVKSLNATMETFETKGKVNLELVNTITKLTEDMNKMKSEILALVNTFSDMEEFFHSFLLQEYLK